MAAKYGTPYFSNYINSDIQETDVRAMCCRLRLDLRELRRKAGGYFGSGESTGSIGVVTLNLPRMSYLSNSEEEFFQYVDRYMDIAARSLDIKRRVVNRMLENSLYPYTKRYLGSFYNYFSTIGLVGMNEAIVNAKWMPNTNIASEEGKEFAKKVLNHMRDRLSDYQEMYNDTLFNLEATPAESTTYRFAKHDVADYPDIITAADPGCTPFYTNSSHLPVGYTADVFEALDNQDDLQVLYTSGTVFHAFLGERLPDWHSAMKLVRTIAENYKLPYFTLSPTYSICRNHGYINGDVAKCPKCGCETETYSRITGYYRPIKNWNDGKAQEFKQRKTYTSASSSLLFNQNYHDILEQAEKAHDNDNEEECEACKIDYDALATSTTSTLVSDFPVSTLSDPPATITTTTSNHLVMITTTTCPNCKLAKEKLNKFGFKYDEVYADKDPEFAKKYNVRQAPTLLILNDSHEEIERYTSLGNISRYVKEHI